MDEFQGETSFAEAKRRQQIRENTPELRDLESQLRLAYINKERSAQIAERQLQQCLNQQEVLLEREENDRLRRLREEEEAAEEQRVALDKLRYQKSLDDQLRLKQIQRNKQLEQFMIEKQLVDEIVEQVKQEQRQRQLERLVKKRMEKEQIDIFLAVQKRFAARERELVEIENERIRHYLMDKERQRHKLTEESRVKTDRKLEMTQKLAEDLQKRELEMLEREELLQELYEGRQREMDQLREQETMQNELRRKMMIKESNDLALKYKQLREENEKQEEEEWKRKVLQEMAEQDRIEQMTKERRRLKQIEHRKELEQMIEKRREELMRERMEDKLLWQELQEHEQALQQIVKEERLKLLQKHAERLIGFLPPSILQDDDLDHLSENVRIALQGANNPRGLSDHLKTDKVDGKS